MKQVTNRFERVDQARGIAIALMILFHIYYSATNIFGFENYVFSDDVWFYIGKISALLFISIAGVSFYIAERKYSDKIVNKYTKIIVQLSLISLGITGGTYFFIPDQLILWGILHFFALSFLSMIFLRKLGYGNVFVAILCFIMGFVTQNTFDGNLFFMFGFTNTSFASADYYPLFPYLGVMLLGYVLGKYMFENNFEKILVKKGKRDILFLEYFGKHSLVIYVVHQPVIFGVLYVIR